MLLDQGRQIGGLFFSADFLSRRVNLFPPRLLSKNEAAMCRPLREVGIGVNDLHFCATHSWGVLKPRNSWLQQSVHHFTLKMSNWTATEIQEILASPRSLELFRCVRLLLCRQAKNGRYFQIKKHSQTAMGCNVKLLFWRQIRCHGSQPNFELHITSHVYAFL